MFFLAGLTVGIAIFSNTVDKISGFWNSSFMGRFTLMDWLNLPTGVVVAGVVILAMFLFWGAEAIEHAMNGTKPDKRQSRNNLIAAVSLSAVALVIAFIGQPTPLERFETFYPEKVQQLENRKVQIEPAELLHYIADDRVVTVMLDVRDEADFNLFHIKNAQHVEVEHISDIKTELLKMPPNTLFVVMSNDEARATDVWKVLVGESVPNVYILEGGVNNWLATYNVVNEEEQAKGTFVAYALPTPVSSVGEDTLRYEFPAALGAKYPAAEPNPEEYEFEFTPKVELKMPQAVGGG